MDRAKNVGLLPSRHGRAAHRVFGVLSLFAFDPRRMLQNLHGLPYFARDLARYARSCRDGNFRVRLLDLFPILSERFDGAGSIGGHYFHQDLWAARKIFQASPEKHIDIGSRIDGFVSHVLTFMPITLIDIRPLQSNISGLHFIQDDATTLDRFLDESVSSISSLHAAEHFGLGRYSDPVDPSACYRFMASLERVLRPGGRLYFSVPIGRERVDFNAHRVFAPETVLSGFKRLRLLSFSYVDDCGELHEGSDLSCVPNLEYGCGLFEFTKSR